MSDDFDDLRSSLKRSSDDFRPALDPAVLAGVGTRRQRRRQAIVSIGGVGALAIAVALVVPALMPSSAVVPAVPAPAATSAPTPPVPPAGPGPIGPITPVSTDGWKTFRSKEFPVTFKYPTSWTIDGDGCDSTNCVLFVQPPEGTKAAPIELIRNGFGKDDSTGGGYADTSRLDILGALPDLAAWAATEGSQQAQALVVRQPAAAGEVDDYGLATGTTSRDLSPRLSVGGSSNWPQHPERVILFSTNTRNIGGTFDKAGRDAVIAILASTRPNASFDPTRGTSDASGGTTIDVYQTMDAPALDAVKPTDSWKTVRVKAANLAVRYPSSWKVVDGQGGVLWITAPSGYIIDLLTNTAAERCDAGDLATAMRIGSASIQATAKSFGSGPVDLVWRNGGEFPVWVGLMQKTDVKNCYQQYLNYGGVADVYLGSADNSANPTQKELNQAVAILASARRLH